MEKYIQMSKTQQHGSPNIYCEVAYLLNWAKTCTNTDSNSGLSYPGMVVFYDIGPLFPQNIMLRDKLVCLCG